MLTVLVLLGAFDVAEVGARQKGKWRKGGFHHFLRNLISQIWAGTNNPGRDFYIFANKKEAIPIFVALHRLTMFVTCKLLGGADCGPGLTLTRLPGSPHYWSAHKNFD